MASVWESCVYSGQDWNMYSSAETLTANPVRTCIMYVRIWSSGVFQCGKTYSSRNSTYVRIYSSLESVMLEHCGELSGIRI